jgi:type II secretion system-associated lipoprotein
MKRILAVLCIALFAVSCDTFLPKDEAAQLVTELEAAEYVLVQDIIAGDRTLAKGTRTKIKVRTHKDWIKVYGYPATENELHARMVLVLYLFKDDFEKEKFNREFFLNKLNERIQNADQVKR